MLVCEELFFCFLSLAGISQGFPQCVDYFSAFCAWAPYYKTTAARNMELNNIVN